MAPEAGLLPQRVELSHLVVDETLGTWGQSLAFALINLTTVSHFLLHVGTQNAFLVTLKNP